MSGANASTGARSERGLLTTELAVLMPIMMLFVFVGIYAVQVQRHENRARSAADAAARVASLHGGDGAVTTNAAQAAADGICHGPVSGLVPDWVPPQPDSLRPGRVVVELTCTEQYGGLAALVGSGERAVTARAVSVIEYWRVP